MRKEGGREGGGRRGCEWKMEAGHIKGGGAQARRRLWKLSFATRAQAPLRHSEGAGWSADSGYLQALSDGFVVGRRFRGAGREDRLGSGSRRRFVMVRDTLAEESEHNYEDWRPDGATVAGA